MNPDEPQATRDREAAPADDAELRDFLDRFRLAPKAVTEAGSDALVDPEIALRGAGPVERRLAEWREHPVSITFDPTGRCNVVCEMCDFHRVRSEAGWSLRAMPQLEPETLRERLAGRTPLRQVIFSGGGAEFFTHPRWAELSEIAREHTEDILVITNGTTLVEKTRERIVELGIRVIRVSFHGATAETAMEIMRGSRFEDVKRNLAALVALREERGARWPRLQISFVGMRKNIDEFPAFVDLAADLGADGVTLSSLIEREADGMEHTRGQSLVHEPARLRDVFERARGRARARGIDLQANEPYRNLVEGGSALDDEPHGPTPAGQTKLCLFPFEKPFVGINGSVGLCCSSTGRNVEMGNADLAGFEAVWTGANYTGLRRALLRGEGLPDFCQQCPRVPNVAPETMQVHAALLLARSTGRLRDLLGALTLVRAYPAYRRETTAVGIPRIALKSIAKAFVRRALGAES